MCKLQFVSARCWSVCTDLALSDLDCTRASGPAVVVNPRHMPVVQTPVVAVQGAAPRALRRVLGKVDVPPGRSQVGIVALSWSSAVLLSGLDPRCGTGPVCILNKFNRQFNRQQSVRSNAVSFPGNGALLPSQGMQDQSDAMLRKRMCG